MSLPANFYIPPSATINDEAPRFRCLLCQEPFWDRTKFGRHMKNCSDAREDQVRSHSLREKNGELFDDQNGGDVELREYVRRTGKWYGFDPTA